MTFTSIDNPSLLDFFQNSDILRRVEASEAKSLSPKAKDCQEQLNAASSVWAVDGKKFLFVFAKKEGSNQEDGDQKVTVWGIKNPGQYQRIKTVLVANEDDIFEAIPVFLTEYFELKLGGIGYRVDEDWYLDIQDELEALTKRCPEFLKPKLKLIRVWNGLMPRLAQLVIDLDTKIIEANRQQEVGTHASCVRVPSGDCNASEGREVLVLKEMLEPSELNEQAEAIMNGLDIRKIRDINLIMAMLTYDYAAMLHESRRKTHAELEARELRMMQCASVLMKMFEAFGLRNTTTLKGLNTTSFLAAYADEVKYEKLQKGMRDLFRGYAQRGLAEKTPPSIEYLELLVNARRFNKRLPKVTSDAIKTTLNRYAHAQDGFWNLFPESQTLAGQLRILWIQCMALKLYGYDPNESYTCGALQDLMIELLTEKDPEGLLLYTLICHDSGLDAVMVNDFDTLILKETEITTDTVSLLNLHSALLIYRASAKCFVPMTL